MQTKLLFIFSFLFLITVFNSYQTTQSPSADERFAKADTNHDGKLSPAEASDYFVEQIFASRDFNHDGKLTWEEWNVPGANRSKAAFDAADLNKDGSMSLDEEKDYARKSWLF